MLAQNQKIIVKVRLAGRQIESGKARTGAQNLDASGGRHIARHEFVVFSHCVLALCNPENSDGGADAKPDFRSPKQRRLASALRHIENVTRLKPDVLSFPLQDFPEIHNDLLLLT